MRTRRLAGAGLGLVATVTFGVAGCSGGGSTGPGAGPTPSASGSSDVSQGPADREAAAALAAATGALGAESFTVTMTSGSALSMTGQMDPPNRAGTGTLQIRAGGGAVKVQTLLLGEDLYLKLGDATDGNKWMHVDAGRLPEGANVGIRPGRIDPANTEGLLRSATDVRQVNAREFAGTLDLTKAVGVTGISKVTVDGYGEAARTVPFRATIDEQSRLSALLVELPAVAGQPAQPLEVRYTDFGAPVTVSKPAAAEVTEAPEDVYRTLGG